MGFEEFVGFIISILAIAFVIGKNIYEEIQKRRHPEDYTKKKHEQEAVLQDFLKSLKGDMEESKKRPHEEDEEENERWNIPKIPIPHISAPAPVVKGIPRTVKDQFRFNTKYDQYKPKSQVEQRELKNIIEERYETQKLGANVVSPDMRMDDPMRAYDIPIYKEQVARGRTILQGLHSRKKMMIIHEIFSPPKGFRNY